MSRHKFDEARGRAWARNVYAEKLRTGDLPNLGPGFPDEARAARGVQAIADRKLFVRSGRSSRKLEAPLSAKDKAFWSGVLAEANAMLVEMEVNPKLDVYTVDLSIDDLLEDRKLLTHLRSHYPDLDDRIAGARVMESAGFGVVVEVLVELADDEVDEAYAAFRYIPSPTVLDDVAMIVFDEPSTRSHKAGPYSSTISPSTRPGVVWQHTRFDATGQPWGHVDLQHLEGLTRPMGSLERGERPLQATMRDGTTYVRAGARQVANPVGRREYVDQLTGATIPGDYPGSWATGESIVRVRPPEGGPYVAVALDDETRDPSRDTFGIDPYFDRQYRDEAARIAKAAKKRKKKPMAADAAPNLRKVGVQTTFSSPRAAAREFMDMNENAFREEFIDGIDALDFTRDFMDRIEVRVGGKRDKVKYAKLAKTPRGREILAKGRSTGPAIIVEMLTFLFGQAGPKRRYVDVPWDLVTDYSDMVVEAVIDRAHTQGWAGSIGAIEWYPLASGIWDEEDLMRMAIAEVGFDKAQHLSRWLNSQNLYRLTDELRQVLYPGKGLKGLSPEEVTQLKERAEAITSCLTPEQLRMLRGRYRVLRHWAKYPDEIPEWACVPSRDAEGRYSGLCLLPAIREDFRRVLKACDVPYNAAWPEGVRADLERSGAADQAKSGIYPVEAAYPEERLPPENGVDEPWDEPWEAAVANPAQVRAIKRRVMRG